MILYSRIRIPRCIDRRHGHSECVELRTSRRSFRRCQAAGRQREIGPYAPADASQTRGRWIHVARKSWAISMTRHPARLDRRLWIMNHYADAPDRPAGTRHYDLARGLIDHGWEVWIFAAGFSHVSRRERGSVLFSCTELNSSTECDSSGCALSPTEVTRSAGSPTCSPTCRCRGCSASRPSSHGCDRLHGPSARGVVGVRSRARPRRAVLLRNQRSRRRRSLTSVRCGPVLWRGHCGVSKGCWCETPLVLSHCCRASKIIWLRGTYPSATCTTYLMACDWTPNLDRWTCRPQS